MYLLFFREENIHFSREDFQIVWDSWGSEAGEIIYSNINKSGRFRVLDVLFFIIYQTEYRLIS
jgi:hypothetical protein